MKILIGVLGAECNTFASDKGTFERWAPNGWITGDVLKLLFNYFFLVFLRFFIFIF